MNMESIAHQFLPAIIFLTAIFFHTTKKNIDIAMAYGVQSLAVVLILFSASFATHSLPSLFIALLVFAIKVIAAPRFFVALIKKHGLRFSATTYLNFPLTLIIIAILTALAHSKIFLPLTTLTSDTEALSLALAVIFSSLFLMINRKGALSQMIGVLSLENGIVTFALFSGLEQSATLQTGILFDIAIWIVIATVFASMIYEHFGSLNVTIMRNLKE
ncbi:MAG: hypothetical protein Q7S16_03590 [bacterium]|nr:hypothetical protein [bacterium]